MAFLALHSITGSTDLTVFTLALILYTISLHIAVIVGASHQLGTIILGILHAIPAAGIFAMASVELAIGVKSPIVASSIIIFCFLPTMIAIFHYLRMRGIVGHTPPLTVDLSLQQPVARLELTQTPT